MNIDRAQIQAMGDGRADQDPIPVQAVDHDAIKAMVEDGRTIKAICHVRDVLKIGLSEAMKLVEEIVGRPIGQRLPPAGAKITHAAILPDGKVEFGYTLYDPVDPADHLYNVLANLGLCDDYEAEYAKHRGKAEPEIATGIALVRNAMNQTEAQRDRLQAILDAERGIKGLPGWVYGREDGGWYVPAGRDRHHAMVYARCTDGFEIVFRDGNVVNTKRYTCKDALDGMERATAMLKTMGLLA